MPTHNPLPTPAEMIAHLDRYVQGQRRAKQDLAVAVYNPKEENEKLAQTLQMK